MTGNRKGATLHKKIEQAKSATDYSSAVLSLGEFLSRDLPPRDWVMEGLLREESITTINGSTGLGKTMLSLSIGNEVAWGGTVGPWTAPHPRNVLMIDAEMTEHDLKSRLQDLNRGRRLNQQPGTFFIYSDGFAYKIGLNAANLLNVNWRRSVLDCVDDLDVGLLILDNLASLARGIDENDKAAFDPINEWLIQVRNHGIAVLLLHHTGKNKGEQRGTSAHLDNLDTALLIERPKGYKDHMGCKILVTATKDRGRALNADSYILQLERMKCGRQRFVPEAVEGINFAIELLRKDPVMTYKEASELGISTSTFYRAVDVLKAEGVIKK